MYVHNLLRLIGRSPRHQRTLRHRGLRKLALNSGTTRRSAKNSQPYIPTTKPSKKPPVSATGMSTSSGDELSLRHLQRETRRRCISTGTSTTVDELRRQGHRPPCQHSNCGNSTVFCTVGTRAPQPCPRTAPVGSHRSSAQFALWDHASSKRSIRRPAQQGHRSPGQSTVTVDTTVFCSVHPKHQSLDASQRLCPRLQIRHCMSTGTSITIDELREEDIDNPDMHNSGHVKNRVQELDTQSPRRRRGTAGTAAA